MVAAMHAAGVKVMLDVVYNHTAEGGGGALLSLRGLDNAGYYQLDATGTGFTNNTGVGADVAAAKPLAAGLILDSLAYWHAAMGIDGFRFDLAPVLGNACGVGCFRFDPTGIIATIAARARPASGGAGVDLVAEPWTADASGYEVGQFPAGWSEWNDSHPRLRCARTRIRQRRRGRGDAGRARHPHRRLARPLRGAHARRIDRLPGLARRLHAQGPVLVQRPEQQPRRGRTARRAAATPNNHSWDHGGDAVQQRQAARTGLVLLALAQGVPMITGGDEMLRTIQCNNNSYDVDTTATWLDWSLAATNAATVTFVQQLLAYRTAHAELHSGAWPGNALTFRDATGAVASSAYLADATQPVLAWQIGSIYAAYNRGSAAVTVTLPAAPNGATWFRSGDTQSGLEPNNWAAPGAEYMMHQALYTLAARSIAVFVAK